ncbi:MAG: aminopeptidase [Pseudomonadota bacterium]
MNRWFFCLRRTVPLLVFALAGCASLNDNLGYYWQSVSGHLQLMHAARPVDDWLADANTSAALKSKLELTQRIRSFASAELHLPDNASYRRYADLKRPAAVWNVVAAPEYSLTLKTWCFPVAGCVGYRGYFSEADARAEADRQRAAGLEASVYGVPAYSTLGWLNWAGGDPLLNTFMHYPEGELARLIFHELAHQVVYAQGDTMFNESFATAVERLGGARWLAEHSGPAAQAEYAAFNSRRTAFRALTLATRRALAAIYPASEENKPLAGATPAIFAMKTEVMARFRNDYAALKARWGGFAGYDKWVAGANNAAFGAQAAYDDLVPGFEALFEREGRNWPRFYDAVRKLATLDKDARHEALQRGVLQQARPETTKENDGA